jgi:hypothetical protein
MPGRTDIRGQPVGIQQSFDPHFAAVFAWLVAGERRGFLLSPK